MSDSITQLACLESKIVLQLDGDRTLSINIKPEDSKWVKIFNIFVSKLFIL